MCCHIYNMDNHTLYEFCSQILLKTKFKKESSKSTTALCLILCIAIQQTQMSIPRENVDSWFYYSQHCGRNVQIRGARDALGGRKSSSYTTKPFYKTAQLLWFFTLMTKLTQHRTKEGTSCLTLWSLYRADTLSVLFYNLGGNSACSSGTWTCYTSSFPCVSLKFEFDFFCCFLW